MQRHFSFLQRMMPTILVRICILYDLLSSILLCLVPKKLRHFLLPSSSPPPPPLPQQPSARTPPLRPSSPRMDPTELGRVFRTFDRNGDGLITKDELEKSLRNLGISVPDEELVDMIGRIDVDGDGRVDIDEFGALCWCLADERDGEEEDMREAFNVFDRDGDGYITVEELRSVLDSLGLKQGRMVEDCRKMITRVDADGDGMVDYEEFRQMMRGGGFAALA